MRGAALNTRSMMRTSFVIARVPARLRQYKAAQGTDERMTRGSAGLQADAVIFKGLTFIP
jgi:hypothetical protein